MTDPRALDESTGPRARLELAVPRPWLAEGATLELTAPQLLRCDRCEGGGCDGCARSGALRAPADPAARRVRLALPPKAPTPCALRVVDPFARSSIEQLLVRIDAADEPSPNVRRIVEPAMPKAAGVARAPLWLAAALVTLALAAVWASAC